MQPQRQSDPRGNQEEADRKSAVLHRSELEAKLLAYRCGWLTRDEIKIRKLERELDRILSQIGVDDTLARRLIDAKS